MTDFGTHTQKGCSPLVGLDKIDREDLFVWDDRNTRGHENKLKRTACKKYKKIQLSI